MLSLRTFIGLLFLILFSCNESKTKLFTELSASDTNINFINGISDSEDFNVMKYGYFYNGGGVAAADFNNDGLTDLFFTANIGQDRLYLNKGKLVFEDITKNSKIDIKEGWKTGVSVVDINNDGWMDIYICRSAAASITLRKNLLFINNKDLTFTESAEQYGLADSGYSTQAVFFDYDKDGDLDCFVVNHSTQQYAGYNQNLKAIKNTKNTALSSRLYRNDQNKFINVTEESGIVTNALCFGLGVVVSDLNGDNWSDIYVSNDYNEEDYMYINQGNGKFEEVIKQATAYTSLFSMGCDAADINNDLKIDILSLDMLPEKNDRIKMTSGDDNFEKYNNLIKSGFHPQYMRNMLQVNTGNAFSSSASKVVIPQFQELGQMAGISNTDWSWSALIADYDLDGNKDIFITNGYEKDYTNMDFLTYTVDLQTRIQSGKDKLNEIDVINKMPSIKEHNYIFKNAGQTSFEDKSQEWGFDKKNVSAGAIYADLDNDGDLDIVVNNVNQKASLYRNNSDKAKPNFIGLALDSKNYNDKIGAKITVYSQLKSQILENSPVRGFQSSFDAPLVFGLGKTQMIDSIVVRWPDGDVTVEMSLQANTYHKIKKSSSQKRNANIQSSNFEKQEVMPFVHEEDEFNDFKIQPLMPFMLSYEGPKIAYNSSKNLSQIYICGAGGKNGVLYNDVNGKRMLIEIPRKKLVHSSIDEGNAIFTDIDNDDDQDLIVAYHCYQCDKSIDITPTLFINEGSNKYRENANAFPIGTNISTTALIDIDYDNDGDNDLFLGSRIAPQNYPLSDNSLLLTNDGKGRFSVANPSNHSIDIGMVTAAVKADIDKDGVQDLILARDFGTIAWIKSGKEFSLGSGSNISESGCWYSVLAQDLDNDGDIDVVGGNLGRNNQLNVVSNDGLTLHYGNFFQAAKTIPVLTIKERNASYPFAARDELFAQIPILKKKFNDYTSYSQATMQTLFGDELKKAKIKSAKKLYSTIFKNQNQKFTPTQLPLEIQAAPIYAIAATDINNDGYTDLIMGGNNEHTRVRIGNMNPNTVTILLNDKNGHYLYDRSLGIYGVVRSIVVTPYHKMIIGLNGKQPIVVNL